MDKQFQIAINLLLGDIKDKEAERDNFIAKSKKAQLEIDELRIAINKLQGRERSVRSDKGKKRVNGNTSVETAMKIVKKLKGRKKRNDRLSEYDKDATFRQKIVFVIASLGRFLHNREIARTLYEYDKSTSEDKYVEKLSAIASRFKADGYIVTYQVGGNIRNTFYGLPGWLDGDGKVKPGYEYNRDYVIGKQLEYSN